MTYPAFGLTTKAVVSKILDGDTIEVVRTERVRLRLRDCWAPELHRGSPEERASGESAKINLAHLLPIGEEVIVNVSGDGDDRLDDSFSMGRAVATVWKKDAALSINELQVEMGYATREKKKT